MTLGEFIEMKRQATKDIRRLNEANVNDEDIGIIMSRDVYDEAVHKELLAINILNFRATYYRHDVFLVEQGLGSVFAPAIKRYQTGLDFDSERIDTGAFIICESSDDGSLRVYMKTQTHPAIFRETGLTVHQVRQTERVTFADRLNVVNRNGRMFAPEYLSERITFARHEPDWSVLSGFDERVLENIVSTIMGTGVPDGSETKKRVKQKQLTPKDTKELDEFLGSFKVLESAT